MIFCYVAFFGTGNIASISSFEISSTYRFTTIFNPFLMASLLIWKIIIPFISVACTFRVINRKLEIPESAAFFSVIALSDVMSLNFFFLVKDFGSWKEIGMSISHFAISNAFILINFILFAFSHLILGKLQLKTKDQ